jgi:dTDP-glucose 4,6-dehydratase
VRAILARLGKSEVLIRHVTDRPGHDRRYALDWGKIRGELGWAPRRTFEETLVETVDWYVANPDWWAAIRGGEEFAAYYARQYGWRLEAAGAGGDR